MSENLSLISKIIIKLCATPLVCLVILLVFTEYLFCAKSRTKDDLLLVPTFKELCATESTLHCNYFFCLFALAGGEVVRFSYLFIFGGGTGN